MICSELFRLFKSYKWIGWTGLDGWILLRRLVLLEHLTVLINEYTDFPIVALERKVGQFPVSVAGEGICNVGEIMALPTPLLASALRV